MTKVFAEISMSLDGYVAGPNDGAEFPLGEGGESLHEWVVGLASWRERHGREGGRTGTDSDLIDESVKRSGAFVMGRRMFDLGEVPWGDTLCKRALEEGRAFTDDVAGCWGDSDAARQLGIQTYMSQPVRTADTAITGRFAASWVARGPCITKSAPQARAREARCMASAWVRSL